MTSHSSSRQATPPITMFATGRVQSPLAAAAKAAGGPNNTPHSTICVTSPLVAPTQEGFGATRGSNAHRPTMTPVPRKNTLLAAAASGNAGAGTDNADAPLSARSTPSTETVSAPPPRLSNGPTASAPTVVKIIPNGPI